MGDINRQTQATMASTLTNEDETLVVDVVQVDGINRLSTDSAISSINVPLGKDPLPDTYFTITTSGAVGDTLTVSLAATVVDSTSPDRDLPAYSYVYTLIAADAGDERQLSINLAEALNNDALFEAQFLEAAAIGDDGDGNLRAIIHITSTKFSLNGEFYERPAIGAFDAVPSGTTEVLFYTSDYRSLKSRPKEVSLARDPNNPHRLGVQNISGSIFIRSTDPETLFRTRIAQSGGNIDLNINGSSPKVFEFSANLAGLPDKVIDSLKLYGTDGNIKVQSDKFLGQNSALNNGILIEFIREGTTIFSEMITSTADLLALWATKASDNKIINQSGGDFIEATFSLVDLNMA